MASTEEQDPSNNDRGFHVGEQKVCVDVDLLDNTLNGYTDITVIPLDFELPHIIIDSRQCEISKVLVNDKEASFTYRNSLDCTMFPESDIHQHHLLYAKLSSLYQKENKGELIIDVPSSVKIRIDTDGGGAAAASSRLSMSGSGLSFIPLNVRIYYSLQSPVMGMTFVSSENPHAFTTSQPIGASTCCWVPCVDNLWERCIWEFEISTHQSMRDLIKAHQSSWPVLSNGDENEQPSQEVPNDEKEKEEEEEEEEGEQDNPDIVVICSGDLVRQIPHPTDAGKKTVIYSLVSPSAAPNIGFAIGPFLKTNLSELAENENSDDENFSANSVEVFAYCLPDKVPDVINTCLFIFKVVNFFTREYGSYPFSTFTLCFVNNILDTNPPVCSLFICPESFLYPSNIIDPVYKITKIITMAVASQWIGINIVPKSYNDLWLISGINGFITYRFIQTLMGNNEYRYRLNQDSEMICKLDIDKEPISNPAIQFPIMVKDLEFINLKSPIVLNILDRRMSKTGGAFGLSRVIPKIFLQAMSGDLLNGSLSTSHFIHICERVSHLRLEQFFNQWVYGCGYPIFRVTQRFNKKKMFVEMGIRQVQLAEILPKKLDDDHFLDDSRLYLNNNNKSSSIQPVFTGPMTIRIHEADGTPYEHVIDVKENFTKLDIPYNTKYKRLKRSKKQKERAAAAAAAAVEDGAGGGEENEGILLHSLGDVLQTDKQVEEWKLYDWSQEDENRMTNEAFEWIRLDADFEWICQIHLNQPDYMFASQLQQDRDVIAQYESIKYFTESKPRNVYSTLLIRTLMDKRYYYGIRLQAALALSRYAIEDVDFLGQFHLVKAFQSLYCFENSLIPLANNFNDLPLYFLQKTIPLALSNVKDKFGKTPIQTRNFLLDLLRYNDNSNNEYSDCYYIFSLIQAITNATDNVKGQDQEDKEFVKRFVNEIDRCKNVDKYIPSYHNIITVGTIQAKEKLSLNGFINRDLYELIEYSWQENNNNNEFVGNQALKSLMILDGIKDVGILKYIFTVLKYDVSPVIQSDACDAIVKGIGMIALDKKQEQNDDNNDAQGGGGMMIVEENAKASTSQRREIIARASISGAIKHVKQELSGDVMIQRELWDGLKCNELSIIEKRKLFNISNLLYDTIDSLIIRVPMPTRKRIVAKLQGKSMLVIKRESKFKIHLSTAGLSSRRDSTGSSTRKSQDNTKKRASIKLQQNKKRRYDDDDNDDESSSALQKTAKQEVDNSKQSSQPARIKIKLKLKPPAPDA